MRLVGTTRGASRLVLPVHHGRPTGRPYKKMAWNNPQKHAQKRTAVQINLHRSATIAIPQCKFISTAVRFLGIRAYVWKPCYLLPNPYPWRLCPLLFIIALCIQKLCRKNSWPFPLFESMIHHFLLSKYKKTYTSVEKNIIKLQGYLTYCSFCLNLPQKLSVTRL